MALLRVGLKENFLLFSIKQRLGASVKDRILYLGIAALAVVVLAAIYYFMGGFFKDLFFMLAQVKQAHALLTLFIMAGQLLILIFGIFYMLSVFYFSKDLDRLVPLPLKPYQVVLSKYVIVLINEYLTVGIIVLPVFIYYGILSGSGLGYWLRLPVIFLLLPVIPLAIASLLVIVFMRVVNISRKKELFMMVGIVLLMAVSLLPHFMKDKPDPGIDQEKIVNFLASEDGLVQLISSNFPPSGWATKGLAFGFSSRGAAGFLLFTGISLLLFLALLAVGQEFFYRGLIGFHEVPTKVKTLKKGAYLTNISSGFHPVKAIFLRELRIMNRTPVFLMNGAFNLVFLPLLILIMALSGNEEGTFIIKLLSSVNPMVTILSAAGFIFLTMSMSATAASTFSREGTRFRISRVIPVSYKTQAAAKFLHSLAVPSIGLLFSSAVLLFYLKISIVLFAPAVILALVGVVVFTALGMIIDLSRPRLDWETPQKAVKNNPNVVVTMFLEIGFIIGVGFLCKLFFSWKLNSLVIYLSLLGVLLIIAFGLVHYLFASAPRKYESIAI